jgi:hypothetical protein
MSHDEHGYPTCRSCIADSVMLNPTASRPGPGARCAVAQRTAVCGTGTYLDKTATLTRKRGPEIIDRLSQCLKHLEGG